MCQISEFSNTVLTSSLLLQLFTGMLDCSVRLGAVYNRLLCLSQLGYPLGMIKAKTDVIYNNLKTENIGIVKQALFPWLLAAVQVISVYFIVDLTDTGRERHNFSNISGTALCASKNLIFLVSRLIIIFLLTVIGTLFANALFTYYKIRLNELLNKIKVQEKYVKTSYINSNETRKWVCNNEDSFISIAESTSEIDQKLINASTIVNNSKNYEDSNYQKLGDIGGYINKRSNQSRMICTCKRKKFEKIICKVPEIISLSSLTSMNSMESDGPWKKNTGKIEYFNESLSISTENGENAASTNFKTKEIATVKFLNYLSAQFSSRRVTEAEEAKAHSEFFTKTENPLNSTSENTNKSNFNGSHTNQTRLENTSNSKLSVSATYFDNMDLLMQDLRKIKHNNFLIFATLFFMTMPWDIAQIMAIICDASINLNKLITSNMSIAQINIPNQTAPARIVEFMEFCTPDYYLSAHNILVITKWISYISCLLCPLLNIGIDDIIRKSMFKFCKSPVSFMELRRAYHSSQKPTGNFRYFRTRSWIDLKYLPPISICSPIFITKNPLNSNRRKDLCANNRDLQKY